MGGRGRITSTNTHTYIHAHAHTLAERNFSMRQSFDSIRELEYTTFISLLPQVAVFGRRLNKSNPPKAIYDALLRAYAKGKQWQQAHVVLQDMQKDGHELDKMT